MPLNDLLEWINHIMVPGGLGVDVQALLGACVRRTLGNRTARKPAPTGKTLEVVLSGARRRTG